MANSVTDSSFKEEVLESKVLVLVDFWAEWCGPCRMLGPIVEELSKELDQNKVKIFKMDIDENPNTPSQYGVRSIPTMILFKEGKVVDTKVGVLEKDKINDWINANV